MPNAEHIKKQNNLVKIFHEAAIAKVTGMRLHYNEEGQAVFHWPHNANFDHALHQVHGGMIATMLDSAGWFTAAPHYDHWIATVEFNTRLHEPVAKEELIATGKIVRLGKRVTSCEMDVKTESGRLIATGAGTFMVTGVEFKV